MSGTRGKREVQKLLAENGIPDNPLKSSELKFAVDYLSFFGYLTVELLKNLDEDKIKRAIRAFQRLFGLKSDGVVGPKTLRAMMSPRCGCPDVIDENNPDHQPFAAAYKVIEEKMAKWNKTGLKYGINSYVGGLPKSTQEDVFAGAWKAWDDVCGLEISYTRNLREADLVIDTGSGRRQNFDGPGGTLAWAYLPTGDDRQLLMRFDLGETWIVNPRDRGILLFNVACHEFGHMIGLTHSKKKGALMAPYYSPQIATPQWDDDIPRAEARYGKNVSRPVPPVVPGQPGGSDDEEIFHVQCKALRVDGYTLFKNG